MEIPKELVELLRGASSVTVLTGAGVSAESGIPTFRDAQTGLWSRYRPEELATPSAFQENPRTVWEWYTWRRTLVRAAQPNPGHFALAELDRRVSDFTLITQNIDGLHQKAGSQKVVELHGNIHRARCLAEGKIVPDWSGQESPPHCPDCGSLLRPDVVWFGEPLPRSELDEALRASRNCELFLSIGTSGVVEPAASLAYEALRGGAVAVEINPIATPLTVYARFHFPFPAGEVLPALVEKAWPQSTAG